MKASSAFGNLALAVGLVLLVPVVILALGAPLVLIVRAAIALVERFS